MESIKRALMMLKPGDCAEAMHISTPGTLRLQATRQGLTLSLKAGCLKTGDYSVYLFLQGGIERYAGDIKDGSLSATLFDIDLDTVQGAAVIQSTGEHHSFCLKSTGMDWSEAAQRFKMTRAGSAAQSGSDVYEPKVSSYIDADHLTLSDVERQVRSEQIDIAANEVMQKDTSAQDTSAYKQSNNAQDIYDDPAMIDQDDDLWHTQETQPADDLPQKESGDPCPHVEKQDKINPFPAIFPNSAWVKISYPGPTGWWHYISGKIYKGSTVVAKVLGVPGEYGMAPPIWLEGFGTYMRCHAPDARGYWLMFQDAETGEVLDPSLSPRGE